MGRKIQLDVAERVAYDRICHELLHDYMDRNFIRDSTERRSLEECFPPDQPQEGAVSRHISVCKMTGERIMHGQRAIKLLTVQAWNDAICESEGLRSGRPRAIILGIVKDEATFRKMLRLGSMEAVNAHREALTAASTP